MKKVSLVLVAILILLSGMLPGCGGEPPPTEQDMVRYVRHDWQIDASVDEIRQVLALADLMTGDSFFSEIGGILTVISMKKDMDRGDYAKAAGKGALWLTKFGLKESGFAWLSSYITLGVLIFEYYKWLYEEVQKGAFNAQIGYYLEYREEGYSEEEMYKSDQGYLLHPKGKGSYVGFEVAPLGGKFTPEDVFVIGRAFWEAKQADEQHREEDEEAIKESFISVLEQLREDKSIPSPEITNAKWVYETDTSPTCVAISTDGYIVVGSSESVYLLDSNKNLVWTYQTDFPITDVSITGCGSRVVAGGLKEDVIISDGIVYYLNNEGELVFSYEPPGVSSVSLSPEGDYYAVTCVHGLGWCDQVNFWGFNEEEWLWYHGFAMDETTSVSVSANGEYVAVGGSQGPLDDGGVCLYNKSGNVLWDYDEINKKELGYDKYSVAISSNGNYIVAGHEGEDNLYFFNKEGEVLWKYNTGYIKGVSISDEGIIIAAASSDKVYLLDRGILDDFSLRGTLEIENIEDISISDEANLLVVATADNKVYAFDLKKVLH